MKDVAIADVRNFALLGHTGSGKTTLADAILHKLGVSETMGSVDDGTSMADYDDDEKERNFTIWSKSLTGIYRAQDGKNTEMVFLDTPGYVDFFGQVIGASRATDTGLIVVDAGSGVQVGTQRAWRRCMDLNLPCGIVITGLDKENADYLQALSSVQQAFGPQCVPVIVPSKDLSRDYSVLFSKDVPDDLSEIVEKARKTIIEDAAETDDTLIEKYLNGEELSAEELAAGLHRAVNSRSLVPVFAVVAKREMGITELLEAICRYFPSPQDHGAVDEEGNPLPVGADAPFCGIVWKTVYDPFAGQLSFVRIFSGTLRPDTEILNASKGEREKISTLLAVNGKKQENVDAARAGDIVAIPKLRFTQTNDSLCAVGENLRVRPIAFPQPAVSYSVVPRTKGEEDKLIMGLQRMASEDPTVHMQRNGETHELILSGMGDIQLEIAIKRMQKRQHIELDLHTPKVPYRETVSSSGDGHYRHKKQSGGRGQFGEVYLRVEPLPDGEEEWFVNAIVGGSIPSNFIPAVQKGLVESKQQGALAGYPVQNVRVTLYDGRFHAVDSSEVAFKIAASRALKDATSKAKPVLLEPIMDLAITVPGEFLGDVNGDLSQRRGRVLGLQVEGGIQVINAEAPQAELFRYSSELRSMTGGRGSFEMRFNRYEAVPSNVAQQIIKETEQARASEN